MNLTELHQNEELRRREFPVADKSTFLAHAGVCPLPRRVADAISDYLQACTLGDQEEAIPKGWSLLDTRALAARLLHCTSEEIALLGPTSVGLSLVAQGLDWKSGDNIIFYSDDYPANVVPWRNLQRRGVELREIRTTTLGVFGPEQIKSLIDSRTKLVALASAHFVAGYRLPVEEIGSWLRSEGILFCVDGIQTLGAIPTMVQYVDFLSADSHKWLLGPCAAGIFYVRREIQNQLQPLLLGANNTRCPHYIAPTEIQFQNHAGRYEPGSYPLLGIVGLHASLKIIHEIGIKDIERSIIKLSWFLRNELSSRGYQLAHQYERHLTGITSFHSEKFNIPEIHRKLTEANIITSLRQTRDGKQWIRVSPHFYNTHAEIQTFLSLLPS
jgi:selenocysteine lyase/cysteine desulfurase